MRLSRLRSLVLLTRPSISLYYHALLLEVGQGYIQEQFGSSRAGLRCQATTTSSRGLIVVRTVTAPGGCRAWCWVTTTWSERPYDYAGRG